MRSRAMAADTALCGSPVRAAIAPTVVSGWARRSLTTIRTVRTLVECSPIPSVGIASSPIFISVRPSRNDSTPFTRSTLQAEVGRAG
ncbi:hypothetical protein GCM10009733_027000 [Nonomuraea maheshkhaliensis]|uniref:Secreted protein n=1 Tax=Nonomuraea maheshkhaliensis TaxID=419590 RepID=A0ABN2F4S5_9ACTN